MPVNTIEIKLDRIRKVYYQGEYLAGTVVIDNKYELKHEGIVLSVEGCVDLNYNLKSVSFMDTFQGTNKLISLIDYAYEPVKAGRLSPGRTELPFKLPIDGNHRSQPAGGGGDGDGGQQACTLYETYHGVFVSIQYCVRCCIKRPLFYKDLVETAEFFVEYDPSPIGAPPLERQLQPFEITPDQLSASRRDLIPDFKITGQLDNSTYHLGEPVTGHLVVERCEAPIRSVELQLVRIETCGPLSSSSSSSIVEGRRRQEFSRDATEIQNIQIGEGNLLRNIPISIYMVLPRLFTCPTLVTGEFRVEFEINLVVIFEDNHLITENFPIRLIRSTLQPIDPVIDLAAP